ncbi:hypothetical protein [Tepidimonas charontis]|uniref:SOS cell division inhibitor SulA n=1 Tax=Tepidimonas charontis TaxID=2267262 RepID=A0A554XB42_9BURK|nr:hypothetical protein [Tepidimonas charontis]TSE33062.1 hypothetical protein Tchar_01870 [Tepidimonas charontis]
MASAEALHPDVWRADQLAAPPTPCVPTGWAALDAVLPGGGWPLGALIELAVAARQLPWRLVQPALRTGTQQGLLVLIDLPLQPQLPVWAAQGVDVSHVLRLQPRNTGEAVWATEQTLQCPQVSVCWLHLAQPSAAALRRLQAAAARARRDATRPGAWPAPLVLCSVPAPAAPAASAAPLRLHTDAGTDTGLTVWVRKRRGPPLSAPVWIDAPQPWAAWLPATVVPLHRAMACTPRRRTHHECR